MELGGASKSPLSTEGVCTSPECVITAGNVLDSMDLTADPCQDFYQFACGGWNRKHFIPDEEAKYTVFEEVFNRLMEMSRGMLETRSANDSEAVAKAKEFYESCTNVELIDQIGAQPLMDLIEEVGGWPVVAGDSWDEEAWDLEEALAKYRMETDYNFLFRHDFMPDMINAGNYIIIIDQPELSLEDRSFYLREKTDSKLAAYFDYMVDIATVLRPDSDREEARRQMADALEFERALANFSVSSAEMRDMSKYKNRYTTRRLQQEMPQIDWLRYFRLIHTDEFSPDEEIINAAHSYFQKTAAHINATSKRTMANFLMWRIVFEMVEYLDSELRNIRQQFMSATMGQKREQSRWKTCFEKTNNNFGVALGSLFIQKHFDGNSKATAQEMLEDIRETLKETLNEVPWMDDQTRANAIRKASKTKEMIGYDDILTDEQAVNDVYRSIDMSPNRFFENIRAIWQTDARESIAHHGKQVEVLLWKQKLIKINAYYRNADNSLIFPAGIFQPPFYSSQFPKSMNYGGIGMVIGHELMHGFDDKGRRFDEDGIMNQWFSNSSAQAYEERKQCFIAQYSSYYVPEVELYLNGKQAQGEVLADNGGIKEAYLGYKRWVKRVGDPGDTLPGINLNHDQLFFLNFAQMWCSLHRKESLEVIVKAKVHVPERFRVLGTLSNSEHFAEAYQCKKGSAMVRDEPCKLW